MKKIILILLLIHTTNYCMGKKEPSKINCDSETKKGMHDKFINALDPEDIIILRTASLFAGIAWIVVLYTCKKYLFNIPKK